MRLIVPDRVMRELTPGQYVLMNVTMTHWLRRLGMRLIGVRPRVGQVYDLRITRIR